MSATWQRIALALGVPPAASGSRCALCGSSPYARAGSTRDLLGVGWSDWGLMADRSGASLCAGCVALISGKPGRVPPPLRLRNLAVVDGVYSTPDTAQMWDLLTAPPAAIEVLSWATSKQKQHHLHAGACTPTRLAVGSDHGTIIVEPNRIVALTAALLALRTSVKDKPLVSRTEILSGAYSTATITRAGARRWADAEAVIAPYRGTPLLALLVAHCPAVPLDPSQEPFHTMALDQTDHDCLALLDALAGGSQLRVTDGKGFWGGIFARRLQRHAHRPFADFVARCMQDLEVSAVGDSAAQLAAIVQGWSAETEAAVMQRIADRAMLLVALTFDARKARKEAA